MIYLKIENLKSIQSVEIELPFKKGVYAITGSNGIGKSTLLNVLSKLVYKGALKAYLHYDGTPDSKIVYIVEGKKNTWIKTPQQWQRDRTESDSEEIFFKGIYEASLIYGNRFSDASKDLLSKIRYIDKEKLINSPDFIKENLGIILHNNNHYYDNLYTIPKENLPRNFKNKSYAIRKDNGVVVHHLRMSSGEFLLIGLLDYIHNRIEYNLKSNNQDPNIIILDEIELALHPSAQSRLIDFLNEISNKYNFFIYFSTHSIQILKRIIPSKIYHLEQMPSGKIKVKNPCHPAYAARTIYQEDGYDFLILVEDFLAKRIIQEIIDNNKSIDNNKLIYILPSGGWRETLKIHKDFFDSKVAGNQCKIISILDGDVKSDYLKEHPGHDKKDPYHNFAISFLPIDSLEKFLYKNLVSDVNDDFYEDLGTFYKVRSLRDILDDYRNNTKKNDCKGKILFKILIECMKDSGEDENIFVSKLCNLIFTKYILTHDREKIENFIVHAVSSKP